MGRGNIALCPLLSIGAYSRPNGEADNRVLLRRDFSSWKLFAPKGKNCFAEPCDLCKMLGNVYAL